MFKLYAMNLIRKLPRGVKLALREKLGIQRAQDAREMYRQSLLATLSRDSLVVFSLIKSGTTYTSLFLSNYSNLLKGESDLIDFDRMNREFCVHSLENRLDLEELSVMLSDNLFFHEHFLGYSGMFTTHLEPMGDFWKKCICLYRNPLDYIISSYFFHYVNRGIPMEHPREIMEQYLESFVDTINAQRELHRRKPQDTLLVAYEELMVQPIETFTKMLKFTGIKVNESFVRKAVENSSKNNVKKMENKRGEAIVKPDSIEFRGSFVRSGKVGEWKEFFTSSG